MTPAVKDLYSPPTPPYRLMVCQKPYARIQLRIELLKKPFLLYDTGKLGSKFDEDRSTNSVTILSTDAGRTDGRLRDFIFCPMHMHCIGQTIHVKR